MAEFGTYVKAHPETGEDMERFPETPAQVVALEFEGWRKKESTRAKSGGTKSSSSTSASS